MCIGRKRKGVKVVVGVEGGKGIGGVLGVGVRNGVG